MKLEFQEIIIEDFKAFRGRHSLPLDVLGVTYLFGENLAIPDLHGNGAAKSTIWDALIWCLYGRTPRGLKNPEVKPWAGGKTAVGLIIKIDGRVTEFLRSTSPNRFTCDGEDCADFQSAFGIGFELAINTILLPQGKDLFLERTPTEKMTLISDAVDLKRWDARSQAAGKLTAESEKEVLALEADKQAASGAMDEIVASLVSTKKLANDWANKARVKVSASKREITELQKRKSWLEDKLATATLKEDGALTELKACEDSLRKMRSVQALLVRSISALVVKVESLSNRLTETEADLKIADEAKTCPTCGQNLKRGHLAQHKADLDQLANEIDIELTDACGKGEELKVANNKIAAAIIAADKAATVFDSKARDAGDTILRLRPEIAELDLKIKAATAIPEENPYTRQIAELTERRDNVSREIREIETELDRTRAEAEHSRFWIKGFKDIKLQLIEDVLAELELVSNSIIEEVGLEGWDIRFSIEKEAKSGNIRNEINVEVTSPESKKPVRWEAYSGGECQRLRLIGSLALADVLLGYAGIETNLEVLDEPCQYWASEGVQELVGFLAYRARERDKSIFFIEHNAVESIHFARVWRVRKDKSGAKVLGV